MITTIEEAVSKQVTLSKADANLLKHAGALTLSVTDVGGDGPEALAIGSDLDTGAGKFEATWFRVDTIATTIEKLVARQRAEVPVIRRAVFGLAESVRFVDYEAWTALPLVTAYERQDVAFFINRCLVVLQKDPAKFGAFIPVLELMRARLAEIDAALRQARADQAAAKGEYEICRAELQKHTKTATIFVLKRASPGSQARQRIKKKSGRKPAPKVAPARATPTPDKAPATNGVPAVNPAAVASVALTPAAPVQPTANPSAPASNPAPVASVALTPSAPVHPAVNTSPTAEKIVA